MYKKKKKTVEFPIINIKTLYMGKN